MCVWIVFLHYSSLFQLAKTLAHWRSGSSVCEWFFVSLSGPEMGWQTVQGLPRPLWLTAGIGTGTFPPDAVKCVR